MRWDESSSAESDDETAARLASSKGTHAVEQLLRLARRVECELGPGPPCAPHPSAPHPSAERLAVQRLGAFLDQMVLSTHEHEAHAASSNGSSSILVTTIHQAKGLEWDHCYMPGMAEGDLTLARTHTCTHTHTLCQA